MEDVFDASWQAGSDGRDPNIETALASLIDVRGVGLITHPGQLRLMLVQACPDAPRHIDALLAAVEVGIAERLRAADDDATLPALLRQCANVLQQKTSLDARWSAWAVRAWAHAFALPTDARVAQPLPVAPGPMSVPFGRSTAERVVRSPPVAVPPVRTAAAPSTTPAPMPVPMPVPRPSMPTPAPTSATPVQAELLPDDEPAAVAPVDDPAPAAMFDERFALAAPDEALVPPASLFDEPARSLDEQAPSLDEAATPPVEPAPSVDEPALSQAEPSSRAIDEAPMAATAPKDEPVSTPIPREAAAAPAIVLPSAAPPVPIVDRGPVTPASASIPASHVPPARRGSSRSVIALIAVIVVVVVAWLGLDAMGRRVPASSTTSQQIAVAPAPVASPPPTTIAQAPLPPTPAAVVPPPASVPPVAQAPVPMATLEPAKREPTSAATTGATAAIEPTAPLRAKRTRPSAETSAPVPARTAAAVPSTKPDTTRLAAQKAHAKELAASRKPVSNPRSEGKPATGTCSEASCGGVVVAARVLDAPGALRGSIYTIVVRADSGRTLSFTTADRPPVGAHVRITGGRLVRIGG